MWLPKILQRLGHLSVVRTSLLSAIPAVLAFVAMLVLGATSDRTGERKWHAVLPRLIAAGALALVVVAGGNVAVALLLLSIATAGILGAYGPIWAIPNTFLSHNELAASNGLITSFGNLGGFVGPYLVGYFSTQTGNYSAGLLAMAAIIGGCSLLLLPVAGRYARAPR
jgi:nitrate/nitrite transporter NarK